MTTFTNNETTYTTSKIIVKGNQYSVTVVTGLHNYINIKKLTNNPFLTLGKEFANFNEATEAYKSPEMKTELLKIELGLI